LWRKDFSTLTAFADLAIAATAAAHSLIILTRNLRHFAPLDVPAHNPFEALP
jgi:toxin FitB